MNAGTTVIRSYSDLLAWKAAVDLAVCCYKKTEGFPRSEIYRMASQIRRSSAAIAANIAERYDRETTPGLIQFLRVAQGSVKELETHLAICLRVGLLDEANHGQLADAANEIGKMLHALLRRLKERA